MMIVWLILFRHNRDCDFDERSCCCHHHNWIHYCCLAIFLLFVCIYQENFYGIIFSRDGYLFLYILSICGAPVTVYFAPFDILPPLNFD